jgi:hypothetical protein
LERLFGEEHRRTKVIPHAFAEKPILKLMYAALIRASQTWRRILIREFELKQIGKLRSCAPRLTRSKNPLPWRRSSHPISEYPANKDLTSRQSVYLPLLSHGVIAVLRAPE